MEKAEHTFQVNLTGAEIWERLKDLALAKHYVPGVEEITFNTKKKSGKGASRRVHPMGMDETVVKWEEGRGYHLKLTKKGKEVFFPFKKACFSYEILHDPLSVHVCLSYEPMIPAFLIRKAVRKRIENIACSMKKFYEG